MTFHDQFFGPNFGHGKNKRVKTWQGQSVNCVWNPGYLIKCDTLDVQIFCVFICIDTFVFIFSCQMQNSFHNYLHVQYTSILYFYIRGEFEP